MDDLRLKWLLRLQITNIRNKYNLPRNRMVLGEVDNIIEVIFKNIYDVIRLSNENSNNNNNKTLNQNDCFYAMDELNLSDFPYIKVTGEENVKLSSLKRLILKYSNVNIVDNTYLKILKDLINSMIYYEALTFIENYINIQFPEFNKKIWKIKYDFLKLSKIKDKYIK